MTMRLSTVREVDHSVGVTCGSLQHMDKTPEQLTIAGVERTYAAPRESPPAGQGGDELPDFMASTTDGSLMETAKLGPFGLDGVSIGDAAELIPDLPDGSIDIVVTSPPYWGQRLSHGVGVEEDPRSYVDSLVALFDLLRDKLKRHGVMWINMGDSYNTPVNWRPGDRSYSSLGANGSGLSENNSAYVKPRAKRQAFVDDSGEAPWLQYGNLLGLPERVVFGLCERGWLYRGRVSWHKQNPMPEGRCRRPHRQEEPIFLLARDERHSFRVNPPVPQVWSFPNEKLDDGLPKHFSRYPFELPRRCIEAYGEVGDDVIVLDPFAGSGTTGIAAIELGCRFVGFEIDAEHADAANVRIERIFRRSS